MTRGEGGGYLREDGNATKKNEKITMEEMLDGVPDQRVDPFALVMGKVGYGGRFQIVYNTVFVLSLSFFGGMIYMNIILALNVPDHWCYVPGINNTNFTLDEWRTITLPR